MYNTLIRVWMIQTACVVAVATQCVAQVVTDPRKPAGFQLVSFASQRLTIGYPKKDWHAFSGAGPTLLTVAQKDGDAAVMIEQTHLNLALAPEEISDVFAQLEADATSERHPGAGSLRPRIIDVGGRRGIFLEFQRSGVAGLENVQQYSLPLGQELYRLICSASVVRFPRYQDTFTQIVRSFQPR